MQKNKALKSLLRTNKCGAIVLFSNGGVGESFYYFTGIPYGVLDGSVLLASRTQTVLVTNVLEHRIVKQHYNGKVRVVKRNVEWQSILKNVCNGHVVGVLFREISHAQLRTLKRYGKPKRIVDLRAGVNNVRAIKSREERQKIARACRMTERILEEIPEIVKHANTEHDVARELEYRIRQHPHCEPAFSPIVALGKHSASPHWLPTSKKLTNNLLLVDIGIRYRNSCSDLTRVYHIGRAGKEKHMLYNQLNAVLEECIGLAIEGERASNLYLHAERSLSRLGFKMVHGLGHGIGTAAHDAPESINKNASYELKENMCLSIEPAFYTKRFGMRLEDNVVVRRNKPQRLSHAPNILVEL
jgi:Xaa-Pro aminopeptidase